jgi:hypothetical protein
MIKQKRGKYFAWASLDEKVTHRTEQRIAGARKHRTEIRQSECSIRQAEAQAGLAHSRSFSSLDLPGGIDGVGIENRRMEEDNFWRFRTLHMPSY